MKFIFSCCLTIALLPVFGQNVGIGTNIPSMKLHVQSLDSAVVVLDNIQPLAIGSKSGLFFRNGGFFTGGIATIGTNTNAARISLFSYATGTPSGLKEYLSVTDAGMVGIGLNNPTYSFQVKRAPAADGVARFEGSVYPSMFSFGASEVTYIRGGKPGAGVYINDVGSGEVTIADGGGNVNLVSGGSGTVNIGLVGNLSATPLVVNGKLQMTGGSPGNGKILTSDAAGNASWQSPAVIPPAPSKIGFSAYLSNDRTLTSNVEYNLITYVEEFDDGNAFSPATGRFTAPEAGLYEIMFNISYEETGNATKYVNVFVNKNGLAEKQFDYIKPPVTSWNSSSTATCLLKLAAGDYITLSTKRSSVSPILLLGGNFANSTFFAVHKLY